jgi:hypothetical protein
MPVKIARSAARPSFGLPELLGSHPHLASVLQQGRKSANIRVSLESSGESRLIQSWGCLGWGETRVIVISLWRNDDGLEAVE